MKLTLDAQGFPWLDGAPLALPPKERAVLALLLRARPAVVDKARFEAGAWGGRPMSDESLARCISRLRRALPGLRIEAVYGSGYRLPPTGDTTAPDPPAHHARLLRAAQAPPLAVDTYLHARQLAAQRTPRAVARAQQLLQALVQAHPGYAAARVALAEAMGGALSWGLAGSDTVDSALAQLDAAEALAPDTPGLASLRGWLLDFAWRFDEAEALHRQASARDGDDAETVFLHAWHLLACGDASAAVARLREACDLQPHAVLVQITLARALAHDGRWDEARQEAEAACREHPQSALAAGYRLGLSALVDPSPGLAAQVDALLRQTDAPPFVLGVASFTLARCGDADGARELIAASLACGASTACSAVMHAAARLALHDADGAAALLQAACAQRCALLPVLLQDPANQALRTHPVARAVAHQVFARRVRAG